MTKTREMIENRIELLQSRTKKDNGRIVMKLQRELRKMDKVNK